MNEHPVIFRCPQDCLAGVGEVWSGQYSLAAPMRAPARVLDIGANVGAYALWARRMWPGCEVVCYEPHPELFRDFLRPNTRDDAGIRCIQAGVGDPQHGVLRPGKDTRLCNSFYDIGRQGNATLSCRVVHPAEIEPAEVVKIDTEGAEGYIVEHLGFLPLWLVLEYHTERLRERVQAALSGKMELVAHAVAGRGWGHLQYLRAS